MAFGLLWFLRFAYTASHWRFFVSFVCIFRADCIERRLLSSIYMVGYTHRAHRIGMRSIRSIAKKKLYWYQHHSSPSD
jgi:hypothetical protein